MAKNYDSLVNGVVDLVGGKDNVEFFTHCVTRLRFNVKDQSKVDTASIEKLDGVLGVQWQNGQLQIIIGQAVGDVYKKICTKYSFNVENSIEENLDNKPKKKKTVGDVFSYFRWHLRFTFSIYSSLNWLRYGTSNLDYLRILRSKF